MAAKCLECEIPVSTEPYDDEGLAVACQVCEGPLCLVCSVRLGGTCTPCCQVVEGP